MPITRNTPSVRSWTVIEAHTPGVLSWAGGNISHPGISTARPPSVVSSLSKVLWTAGASSIGLRNIRDVDTLELLHPNRHLVGEQS